MLKLLGPAAVAAAMLALAGALPAQAAPAHAGASLQIDPPGIATDAVPVHHTYQHTLDQERYARERRRALRYHYRPYRPYYAPRCHWSQYYQRRICR